MIWLINRDRVCLDLDLEFYITHKDLAQIAADI